jgi:hypothetical protein
MDAHTTGGSKLTAAAKRFGRRGALAIAAAAGLAALAEKRSTPTVEAGHDGTNVFHLGVDNQNSTSNTTTLTRNGANASVNRAAVSVVNSNGIGLYGQGSGSGASGFYGVSDTGYGLVGSSTSSYGVIGSSTSQAGVYGSSNTNVGVTGNTISGNGVYGFSQTGIGVYGVSGSGTAGQFDGNVYISGNLNVSGMKSALVPSSSGHRLVFCLESPKSYFEDFGRAQLTGGQVTVQIDPTFQSIVRTTEQYFVYLTPENDCNGLGVSDMSPDSFTVRELRGGQSSASFSYRIVALRADVSSERMPRVNVDQRPRPVRIERPTLPEMPQTPGVRRPATPEIVAPPADRP